MNGEPQLLRPLESSLVDLPLTRSIPSLPQTNGPWSLLSPDRRQAGVVEAFDLRGPTVYLNRELSWLNFNRRVLSEAADSRMPLLERVKFLAIFSSNLDEFFMKRIGGLKRQLSAEVATPTVDGRTPRQQIDESYEQIADLLERQGGLYAGILDELRDNGIFLEKYENISDQDRAKLRTYYIENILPLITPFGMDPSHPFPFISNLSLNLFVTLRYPNGRGPLLARVKVPVGPGVPRFLRVGDGHRFVRLEDLMIDNLELLFPGLEVTSCDVFRVTRNAQTENYRIDADDLSETIESELRNRKFAPVVRLQTYKGIDPNWRRMLTTELGLDDAKDVTETDGMIGMSDLMAIAGLDVAALRDPPHHAADNAKLRDNRSIFQILRDAGSILLHHPYESFATSVERFVREASCDPKVAAIKMTLYRTSADTKIIDYLIDAAQKGKQVSVVVELQARFDEAANIRWAKRLEEAGVHVNYGVLGLKTHCKVILVVRRDHDRPRRYAHIGTGNYHEGTARLYSDIGLLVCDDDLGNDLSELFNYLTTGWNPERAYRKILTAPLSVKAALLAKIQREIACHSPASPGLVRFKTNALEDADITAALYRASQAGVKVEVIARDICRLRPGIPGLSDNISVISVVGRFLEHSRIYYFRNGGDEEYYIGSADLMTRNLERRVEILAPVIDAEARQALRELFEIQLSDRGDVWQMDSDGSYSKRAPTADQNSSGCQDTMIAVAARRIAQSLEIADLGMPPRFSGYRNNFKHFRGN